MSSRRSRRFPHISVTPASVTPTGILSACPELMEAAARRLDRRWEAMP
jgi:hypothetical protein